MINIFYKSNYILNLYAFLGGFFVVNLSAQNTQEKQKSLELSQKYAYEANKAFSEKKNIRAEMEYRKAISENQDNNIAQYNLGNAYYLQKSYGEALLRYKNAATTENISPAEKHKVMHNLGNVMMQEKIYDKAVEAYKEALRNDPTDEQTRYNLAIAQDMLKKYPPQNEDNQQKDNENQNNSQENKNNNDKENSDDNKDSQNENKQEDKEQNENNQNNSNKENPQDNKTSENQNKQEGNEKRPSELSPQQIERILEAMNNEEKKVQERINAKKMHGKPIRSDKDW